MGPPWPAVIALSRISNLLDAHWFHALLQKVRKVGEDFSLWLTLVSSSW